LRWRLRNLRGGQENSGNKDDTIEYMDISPVCKSCQNPVSQTYFFCPYCGKVLRRPPLSTSIRKQVLMYFLAIVFPLFTILMGVRYLGQEDNKSKTVGIVVLLLTGVSLLVNVYLIFWMVEYFNQMVMMSI
jgi:predicted RNA-binding Zn-ribbon protein involved in translation (DUF1610 family)